MTTQKKRATSKPKSSAQTKKRQSTPATASKNSAPQSLQRLMDPTGRVSTGDVLTLQRSLGNSATTQLIQRRQVRKPVNLNTLFRSPDKQNQASQTNELAALPQSQELGIQQARPGIQRRNFDKSKTKREGATEILGSLKDSNWGDALGKYQEDSVVYNKAAFLGGAGWVKWFRGVSGSLNTARKNAKALLANKQTTKAEKHIKTLTEIAGNAYEAVSNTKHFWGTNHQHSAAMARKIVYYLVNALPDNLLASGVQDHAQKDITANQQNPQAILMMGGSGSGKSTIISKLNIDTSKMVVADADAVKAMMPKYSQGVHEGDSQIASTVHKQSNSITAGLVEQTIASKKHLLYDATGANYATYMTSGFGGMFGKDGLFKKLDDAGYSIKLVLAHIPMHEGLERVKARGERTGRKIPERIVKGIYRDVPKNFVNFSQRGEIAEAEVYDTMTQDVAQIWKKGEGLRKLKFAMGYVDDNIRGSYERKIKNSKDWYTKEKAIRQGKMFNKDFNEDSVLNGGSLDEIEQDSFKYLSQAGTGFANKASGWNTKNNNVPDEQQSPQYKLIKKYGLTVGEAAAIGIYTAADFKYMNPAMAQNDGWLKFQMDSVSPATQKYKKALQDEKQTQGDYQQNTLESVKAEALEHNLMAMAALKKLPNWSGNAYRGAGFTELEISQKFPTNGIATMEAFTSTSLKAGTSRGFANSNTDEERGKVGVFMDMKLTRGKDIEAFSNTQSEKEILVLPYAQFNVKRIDRIMDTTEPTKEKYRHIFLEQVS